MYKQRLLFGDRQKVIGHSGLTFGFVVVLQRRQGIQDPKLVRKFYEDGKLFMLMFPDGTGNVLYP